MDITGWSIRKFEKMTPKEVGRHMDFWEAMIVQSVVAPEMCIEPEDGKLEVRLLTPEDMDKPAGGDRQTQHPNSGITPETPECRTNESGCPPVHPSADCCWTLKNTRGNRWHVYGEVDGELSDIGISPRQGNSIGPSTILYHRRQKEAVGGQVLR